MFEFCEIVKNFATNGGAMYVDSSNPEFYHCVIDSNRSTNGYGGAVYLANADAVFSYCDISHNTSIGKGGGIYLSSCDPIISYCTICDDSAANYSGYGGAIYIHGLAQPQIENCTFSRNYAEYVGGTMYLHSASSPQIKNCIIEGSLQGGGIFVMASYNASLTYNDIYNNSGGNFPGITPASVGILTAVNVNGDSCDQFCNIFLNPLFENPTINDYYLQEGSPCIDAGDPASPLDPDSTIADIGALYFNQETPGILSLNLTPHNPPIIIPAGGGSFQFDISIVNNTASGVDFDFWIEALLPNGNTYPVMLRSDLFIGGGVSVLRPDMNQNVPANAPPGIYEYIGKLGQHPDSIMAWDSFEFEKLSAGGFSPSYSGWEIQGWEETGLELECENSTLRCHAYPNPFNPVTEIVFNLPGSAMTELKIFDVSGRQAAVLEEGWLNAGEHRILFNGEDLASGIYFFRLSAG